MFKKQSKNSGAGGGGQYVGMPSVCCIAVCLRVLNCATVNEVKGETRTPGNNSCKLVCNLNPTLLSSPVFAMNMGQNFHE